MHAILLRDVRKAYHIGTTVVTALNNVSLEIAAGELIVITGPAASGKSTLLNVLAGEKPDGGAVLIQVKPLLLDEPRSTTELKRAWAACREQGRTVVIATSDESIGLLADKVIQMREGHIRTVYANPHPADFVSA